MRLALSARRRRSAARSAPYPLRTVPVAVRCPVPMCACASIDLILLSEAYQRNMDSFSE
jgi:hypothetical protein